MMARFQIDVSVKCSLCGGTLETKQDPQAARPNIIVEPCPKCLDVLYLRSVRPKPDPLSIGG